MDKTKDENIKTSDIDDFINQFKIHDIISDIEPEFYNSRAEQSSSHFSYNERDDR